MVRSGLVLFLLASSLIPAAGADADRESIEYFESKVRPILVNRCQSCHGPEKQKGGLRLDGMNAILKGGDSGPALVPGKPAESLLVEAIGYLEDLKMPPKSKLPEQEISILKQWVETGAAWPVETTQTAAKNEFNFAARAKHWSFQPIANPPVPPTQDQAWPNGSVDSYLLQKLEAAGLKPASDTDKRTLIRRVTYDLIGLPATTADIDAFLADSSPDAYAKVVERLLKSPHYGERWGRHWLDLVRYAETSGHEFDYEIPDAWRYRDYVIKAFNDDLPYNQFVIEQLAGDLLKQPRMNKEGMNESVIGTGVYFMGEGTHSPVDLRDDEAGRLDHQIDVLGKTFLGLTIACARCHDHKFDPIRQADYYAFSGYLKSSRFDHARIDSLDDETKKIAELKGIQKTILEKLGDSSRLASELKTFKLDPKMRTPGHPFYAWAAVSESPPDQFEANRSKAQKQASEIKAPESELFEDFNQASYVNWTASGTAFGTGPSSFGALHVTEKHVTPVGSGVAHSGLISDKLSGVLRSRLFPIKHRYIHYRAWGKGARIHAVINSFEKIRDPIYGRLAVRVESPEPRWITQDLGMWVGQTAYLELSDGGTVLYDAGAIGYHKGDGYLAVDEIHFSNSNRPPLGPDKVATGLLEVESKDELASKMERVADATLHSWRTGDCLPPERAEWLAWFIDHDLIKHDASVNELIKKYQAVEASIAQPNYCLSISDGTPENSPISIRGNPHSPGEVVQRRLLEVLGGSPELASSNGSGRSAFAEAVASPSNPLTARVMVNRIWKHHFGVGLVPSPDDFGAMGQAPTHPELLDHLATQFIASGWSIKAVHRLIVMTHAYQMSSNINSDAEVRDPNNVLLHRMPVRRLEAEAIRDAMLAIAGKLDPKMYGPSVPTYLTSFMEGRGRPGASGPLDGDGRRSIYLGIRRNFPNPFLLAFDAPQPNTAIGRRNVSNVPAQALSMLNDPFVIQMAGKWADRLLATDCADDRARVSLMYQAGFGRVPTDAEIKIALEFLGSDTRSKETWRDLCHVIFNAKEFIFIN